MRIAICDEDMISVEHIEHLIYECNKFRDEIDVCKIAKGKNLLKMYNEGKRFDIIYFSIDNIKALEEISLICKYDHKAIVFVVTSVTNYISASHRLGVFQFLIKPIQESVFKMDYKLALNKYNVMNRKYEIRTQLAINSLEFNDISYLAIEARKIFIKTKALEKVQLLGTNLKREYEKLKPYDFNRCHQSIIVNLNMVKKINGNMLILYDGEALPISRQNKKKFLEEYVKLKSSNKKLIIEE